MYETEYLKLKVAQEDDFYNINEHAENMEKIDGKLKEVKETEEGLRELVETETERARSAETKNAEDIEKVSSGLTSEINNKISDLIGGAPETLDTLKEIADAIAENETIVDALNEAIGKKVNIDDFNTQMTNLGKSVADGKALLASTISAWGNPTASDATFEVLNTNMAAEFAATRDAAYSQGVTAADGRALPGTVNYQSGYNQGVADADGRANSNSANWQNGYATGVAQADGRALPGSVNYQSGYNQGASDKHAYLVDLQHSSLVSGSGAFGAWIALWTISKTEVFPHRLLNTGTWREIFNDIRGDRRIKLAVGYGDINASIGNASSNLAALWAI